MKLLPSSQHKTLLFIYDLACVGQHSSPLEEYTKTPWGWFVMWRLQVKKMIRVTKVMNRPYVRLSSAGMEYVATFNLLEGLRNGVRA
jgi:hypothetical protein